MISMELMLKELEALPMEIFEAERIQAEATDLYLVRKLDLKSLESDLVKEGKAKGRSEREKALILHGYTKELEKEILYLQQDVAYAKTVVNWKQNRLEAIKATIEALRAPERPSIRVLPPT
ncbi:hypothetical protein [Sutcliffiella horikoshii]|uniref:hypothetical protein n=1 Tax=Sutcliffiella horikoshii TaxID=79883 RepID=UPI00384BDF2E